MKPTELTINLALAVCLFFNNSQSFAKDKKQKAEEFNDLCVKLMQDKTKSNEAIKACNSAIKLNSSCWQCYHNRGSAKITVKDFAGAIADFDRVTELNPDFQGAYLLRGYVKVEKLGDQINLMQGCIEDLASAIAKADNPRDKSFAKSLFEKYCNSGAHKDGQSDEPPMNDREDSGE